MNTATYLVRPEDYGWLAFGGNVHGAGDTVTVDPLDSSRRKLFVEPLRLWIAFDSGEIESAQINSDTKTIRLSVAPASNVSSDARFALAESGEADAPHWKIAGAVAVSNGHFKARLSGNTTMITLTR